MTIRISLTTGQSGSAAAMRALVLSLLLFVAEFGTHEVMHLLVLYAVGVTVRSSCAPGAWA